MNKYSTPCSHWNIIVAGGCILFLPDVGYLESETRSMETMPWMNPLHDSPPLLWKTSGTIDFLPQTKIISWKSRFFFFKSSDWKSHIPRFHAILSREEFDLTKMTWGDHDILTATSHDYFTAISFWSRTPNSSWYKLVRSHLWVPCELAEMWQTLLVSCWLAQVITGD